MCKEHWTKHIKDGGARCLFADCDELIYWDTGVCRKHWSSNAVIAKMPSPERCRSHNCKRHAVRDGYCVPHDPNGKRRREREAQVPHKKVENECTMDGCENTGARNGLCVTHSNKSGCKTNGCETDSLACGYCEPCARTKIKKSFEKDGKKRKLSDGGWVVMLCREEGCVREIQKKGKCTAHGGARGFCTTDGCKKSQVKGGKCRDHGGRTGCKTTDCTSAAVVRGYCSSCDPGSKCVCGNIKKQCVEHHDPSTIWCATCNVIQVRHGAQHCDRCRRALFGVDIRVEHKYREKFAAWGFHPSATDVVIKEGGTCKVVKCDGTPNLEKGDYVFILPEECAYDVLAECDENEHLYYGKECEEARLDRVADQVMANTGVVRGLVVIRFNPDCKHDIDEELRAVLTRAMTGGYVIDNDRGVKTIYIGYKQRLNFRNCIKSCVIREHTR